MAGLAVSELEKRNNALLVWNKINKKDGKDNSFELNDGKEVNLKFNPVIMTMFPPLQNHITLIYKQ